MWIVSPTPTNYTAPQGEPWCIIDEQDGDIHAFYFSKEAADEALTVLVGVK